MGVCCDCGQEGKTYFLDGGEFCRDCFLDRIEQPEVVIKNLDGFIVNKSDEFVDWLTDVSAGDTYQIKEYIDLAKAAALEMFAKDKPELFKEAMVDFRKSKPGEWEDYMEEVG